MVVGVNGGFKIPVGYFLINGMSGEERANIIVTCLKKLHDIGVLVVSLTSDGPPCNFTMLKELGACLDVEDEEKFITFFFHPLSPDQKIFVMLDICHMIKLIRITLGKGLVLVDGAGGRISWEYIKELEKVQSEEGLRLGKMYIINSTHF